jgi:hypothetical protein
MRSLIAHAEAKLSEARLYNGYGNTGPLHDYATTSIILHAQAVLKEPSSYNKAWDMYTKLVAERSELRITLPFFLDQVEQMCQDFNTSMLDKSIAHIRDLLKETDRV